MQPEQPAPKKKGNPLLGALAIFVIILLCVVGIVIATSGDEEEPADPVSADRKINAEVMCEQFIEKRLKAPATAEYTDPETSKAGASYTVKGAVDSENGFGAKIRTPYVCVVKDNGDDTWTLVDLNMSA